MDKDIVKNPGVSAELWQKAELNEFITFVNHMPPKDSVLDHPLVAGVHYIPIGHIEEMLTKVFKLWDVEILREGQLLNSVYVTVRLNYFHPIIREWRHQDGVGAVAIQVDKGFDASDLKHIKSNAIMLALPSAKSFAIKDAAEHIGKSFGRDINRKDVLYLNSGSLNEDVRQNNQLIVKEQLETLVRTTKEYSGLDEAGASQWFEELIGLKYHQVKKNDLNAVVKKLSDERLVF